ncbi:MAG TPA: hypothetical protein VJQ55_03980 [Candidatus Binatia bacterium]|nr:hypothetical protein [Candidatus Binatia bacterium]
MYCAALLHAQSSPLTVQPSTGRVGVGVTNPGYSLDVGTGTVNAGFFRGDGSQLTNLPGGGGGGGGTGGYGSRGQFSRNNAGAPDSQYDLKADVVILSKPSDQSTVTRYNPGTISNNVGLAGPIANGRDQSLGFSASSWIHFYWIWNGTTLATVSSATPPPSGPTLPTGYTHWSYAGAVRLNATSQLVRTFIQGSRAYATRAEIYNGTPPGSEQSVSVSSFVPPNALGIELSWNAGFGATTNTGIIFRFLTGVDHIEFRNVTNASSERFAGSVSLPNVNQTVIFVKESSNPVTLDVAGYTLPNGGE